MAEQKITRGNASQYFVASELCRRRNSVAVTLAILPLQNSCITSNEHEYSLQFLRKNDLP